MPSRDQVELRKGLAHEAATGLELSMALPWRVLGDVTAIVGSSDFDFWGNQGGFPLNTQKLNFLHRDQQQPRRILGDTIGLLGESGIGEHRRY